MLDERVLGVLARLEAEDAAEREAGLPASQRSRQVEATTGRFLFALAASQAGIEVLEIGGSRGYSSIWLAAGARVLGGRLVSLEHDPVKCAAWRANIADAGLDELGRARRRRRSADAGGDPRYVRPRLPRRREGRLRDAVRPRATAARARRSRDRRQRPLARGDARRVLGGAPGRSDAVERHRAARPRARAVRRACDCLTSTSELERLDDAARIVERISTLPPSARSAYAGITAERRWSGLSDDSTGSGGTSG